MDQKPKLHPAVAVLIVIVLIGIVASVVIVVNANKDKNQDTQSTTTSSSTTGGSETAAIDSTDTSQYKDGTYAATGSYLSPGGRESIELTVTIKDGVITDTTLATEAASRDSKEYQALFTNNYKELVVGKKVNGLSLSRVAGSSLTSNGFNNALDEIRDEARV